jgi:alpha-tubulin suppressor-like RCC1 family protein
VVCGNVYALAVKTNGTLWTWGLNEDGQLEDGTVENRGTPVQGNSDRNWATVAAQGKHTLAVKTNGTLLAWGNNGFGQLGIGGLDYFRSVPALALSMGPVVPQMPPDGFSFMGCSYYSLPVFGWVVTN